MQVQYFIKNSLVFEQKKKGQKRNLKFKKIPQIAICETYFQKKKSIKNSLFKILLPKNRIKRN
jgi:hypothetical protein